MVIIALLAISWACVGVQWFAGEVKRNSAPIPSSIAEAECEALVQYWDGRKWKNGFGMEMKLTDFTNLKELKRSSTELVCVASAKMENGGRSDWELYVKDNEGISYGVRLH